MEKPRAFETEGPFSRAFIRHFDSVLEITSAKQALQYAADMPGSPSQEWWAQSLTPEFVEHLEPSIQAV